MSIEISPAGVSIEIEAIVQLLDKISKRVHKDKNSICLGLDVIAKVFEH